MGSAIVIDIYLPIARFIAAYTNNNTCLTQKDNMHQRSSMIFFRVSSAFALSIYLRMTEAVL